MRRPHFSSPSSRLLAPSEGDFVATCYEGYCGATTNISAIAGQKKFGVDDGMIFAIAAGDLTKPGNMIRRVVVG